MQDISIRKQNRAADLEDICTINAAAFAEHGGTGAFDGFRAERDDIISLVALADGKLVGHVLFSPVIMNTPDEPVRGMGLGQLAIAPDWQRQGIGTQLAEAGIVQLREQHCPFIIVIGHATYYPRLGFQQGSLHDVQCQWKDVPNESFMVLYLDQSQSQQERLCGVASFDGL